MSNIGISLSLSDPAGQTILSIFKEHGFSKTVDNRVLKKDNMYLIIIEPLIVPEERFKVPETPDPYPIDYDKIASEYDIDYIVITSRHWAKSGTPSLTLHATGNFGKAMYGGNSRELQMSAPQPMRNIYLELESNPPQDYQVSLEATHHSPTQFRVPMFFVEVGSREHQWRNEDTCSYLVKSIINGIKKEGTAPASIGFGGGHYCPYFSPLMKERAMGHIAAKYNINLLTLDLIQQMIEKTPGAENAILDKGLKSKEKRKISNLLKKIDFPTA